MAESPEEQPSTGVLGRIGSWFSPWRGKASQTENVSPSDLKSEEEEQSEKSVRSLTGEQQWEEENSAGLCRDIFPCEKEDATQSGRRDGSLLSSTQTGEGGPKEEEPVEYRKKRTGQGKEREESSNGTVASGNPEKNASHLTHLSSSSKQGVVWDTNQAHAQPQTKRQTQFQTGKRLHVYLEETSVIQCGQDSHAGQEVVCTTVTKSLQVIPKAKPSASDLQNSSSPDIKRINVRPAAEAENVCFALEGVSLKSHKDSQLEPEKEQTETDGMGRKNSARRRVRKNSQGDGATSPRANVPQSTQPVPGGSPSSDNSATSPQGKSPKTHMRKEPAGSSSEHRPTSEALPEGGEISFPDKVKQLDNFQDSNPVTAATQVCVVDGGADMEDEDSLYKVERKTETPESKRRSMKVSLSEVKFFRKNVPLKPKDSKDCTATPKDTKDEVEDKPKTETDSSVFDPKKSTQEPNTAVGRIADRISLFEQQQKLTSVPKQTIRIPRSADVSPARKATDRLKESLLLSDQRSRSAERYGSTSPAREKPMTIKERAKIFTEACVSEAKPTLPKPPAMTGMSQKSTSSVAPSPVSQELGSQDKLHTKEATNSEITLKPEGQDTTAIGVQISTTTEAQQTDSTTEETVVLETVDQSVKTNSVETGPSGEEQGVSAKLANNTSKQSKGPNRTGSRSKRRKNKEPTSPISPNNQNKPDSATSKPKVTAIKQEQVDNTEETASEQPAEKASLPSLSVQGGRSDEQPRSDTKQEASKQQLEESEKVLNAASKENIYKAVSRQEGLSEPSVNTDEPDTAACSSGTKKPIDEHPVILPQKEEKAEAHSFVLTEEGKNASEDNKETSTSSPSPVLERAIEPSPAVKQDSPVEMLSVQHESKKPGEKQAEQHQNNTRHINEIKDVEKTNQTKKKKKENLQQLLPSNKCAEEEVSDVGEGITGKEGIVVKGDESTKPDRNEETQTVEDKERTSGSSDISAVTQHVSQVGTTHPAEAAVCTITQTNEAVSGTESDKVPVKVETATNVPAESPGKAEPQPHSVSVEKTQNQLDDSRTHGANDAVLSSSKPITEAVKKVTSKITNDTSGLITTHTEKTQEELPVKEPPLISAGKSASARAEKEKGSTVKSAPSDVLKPAPSHPQAKEAKHTENSSDVASLKDAKKITQKQSEGTFSVTEKSADKTSPVIEPSSVANGDTSTYSASLKKEPVNTKQSQPPKAHSSSEANRMNLDPIKRSSMRKLHLLSKDDSFKQQDVPSSWLDVDFPKQKLKAPGPKLTSSGSESNLLDTSGELDDEDFVQKIKKLCVPFSLPPRKHNHLRPPQPPFAMPAIREDRFEKTFDPEEFTIGLRKKTQFNFDTTPSLLAKLQNTETKPSLKPARASFADRSLLLSSLREKTSVKDEEDVKEEKDDQFKVKSRLDGSCVLGNLTSSSFRGKKNGVQTQAEATGSGNVSPNEAPQLSPLALSQPPPPSSTTTAPTRDSLAKQNVEEVCAAEAVVSDSGPPLPSFNDIKLPDYLEKYLPRDPAKTVQSVQGQEQVKPEFTEKMATLLSGAEADVCVKPAPVLPDTVAPCFPGIPAATRPTLPELKQPPAQPQGKPKSSIRTAKGFHKRPGKMVLFEKAQFGGQAYEIYRDVADATSLQLSPLISVKVFRGCWVLYEKPDFQGRTIALEEGATELTNMWAESEVETEHSNQAMLIGSIRLAVMDYSIPHIDLFTEPEGHGRVTPYHDDTIETGSFGIPLSTASIQVHSGVWLVFSDPGFQGMVAVLETGAYPFPETWGFPSPFIGSLRPLKMGAFKVENPSEVKAVLYKKPGFGGTCVEIDSEVFSFCEAEGDIDPDGDKLKSVASLKIIGGFWVGYSEPGFEGQQYILEEGEYLDCSDWGGLELLSLQPILSDFMSPHLKLFSDRDFGKLGVNIDLTVPVTNMDDTGYGMKTQSIDVIGGVWVVFEEPGFCGESYILEKGLYGSPEDWGALQHCIGSTMPVLLDNFENTTKFKVQLFSDPGFQGSVLALEDSAVSLQDSFSVASCKVLAGSWLAFEGQDFTGKMYVLEEGSYPDLRAMGCVSASGSILSLQTVGFEFSLPSITLFERSGLRGKRVLLTEGSVNLQLAGGCGRVQSVLVEGGMWVLYEGINYRGAQILLKPGEVLDWRKFSSWQKIGSLRPLLQKQVHFRLRNRQTGLMMSVTGDMDDVKLLRIQEMEEMDGLEQIWFYQNGHLHCKLLEDCCLRPNSSVLIAGSRVGLSPETDTHLWSITPEGFIHYTLNSDLVLETKGGHHYDKNQVILNTLNTNKLQQRWDVEII
ncbi:beta/gamma crystallin domain-containing protein 1-like isoform X2 [Parambassis ranga]|uniref:Beta/gamma crystallin domain-containing protein 1-like isoform X2 n=1 Tax=Parambassis ranga TaxID=210632 RepID=A0A6P7HUZ5_9TELE|nr:beta/gamma crystallin domain-containing protein 1-like isoform X2 [Parambassis ranga]